MEAGISSDWLCGQFDPSVALPYLSMYGSYISRWLSLLKKTETYSQSIPYFLGYALSLLAGNATMISEDFNMTEVFTVLTEVIRDNFRNAKLKQHLLPALGEFLFYAATQGENLGCTIPQWDVPGNFCMCQGFQ